MKAPKNRWARILVATLFIAIGYFLSLMGGTILKQLTQDFLSLSEILVFFIVTILFLVTTIVTIIINAGYVSSGDEMVSGLGVTVTAGSLSLGFAIGFYEGSTLMDSILTLSREPIMYIVLCLTAVMYITFLWKIPLKHVVRFPK